MTHPQIHSLRVSLIPFVFLGVKSTKIYHLSRGLCLRSQKQSLWWDLAKRMTTLPQKYYIIIISVMYKQRRIFNSS